MFAAVIMSYLWIKNITDMSVKSTVTKNTNQMFQLRNERKVHVHSHSLFTLYVEYILYTLSNEVIFNSRTNENERNEIEF